MTSDSNARIASNIKSRDVARKTTVMALCGVVLFSTVGCSSLTKAMGGGKSSPDEFAVVTKAPLVIPPDFSLRPPKPGAARPQERNVADAARDAVFSSGQAQAADAMTDGEMVLLTKAGADDADNSIRDVVDSEFFNIHRPGDGFANKVLFWQGDTVDPGTLVDSAAEEQRLKDNEALGEPVTEGQTPVID